MANFNLAYEKMLIDEGGYKLTEIKDDRGGMTYAGISRRANPNWGGWSYIDSGDTPPSSLVRDFYREYYWNPVWGDLINKQPVAESLFNFAVNAGTKTAIKLAQIALHETPDGTIGEKTIGALNATDPRIFIPVYAVAKIARYRDICTRDRSQMKFLLGWINRTLREASV